MLFSHFLSLPTSGFTTAENGSTILQRESSLDVCAQIDFCCGGGGGAVLSVCNLLEELYLFVVW